MTNPHFIETGADDTPRMGGEFERLLRLRRQGEINDDDMVVGLIEFGKILERELETKEAHRAEWQSLYADACNKLEAQSVSLSDSPNAQHIAALECEIHSRADLIRRYHDIIGYNNDDGFHIDPSPETILRRLVAEAAYAEELRADLTMLRGHLRWRVSPDAAGMHHLTAAEMTDIQAIIEKGLDRRCHEICHACDGSGLDECLRDGRTPCPVCQRVSPAMCKPGCAEPANLSHAAGQRGPYPRCDAIQREHGENGASAWQSMVAYRELARTLEQELRCHSQVPKQEPTT